MKRYAAPTVKLTGIRAQLNATTNYVLTRMQDGVPEIQAIAEAQASGLCRNTPQLELDGWDGSIQSAILANVLMREIQVEHVFREKFQQRAPEIIKRTTKNIHKVRQIVNIENLPGEIKASVRLQVISADDPFYHLNADDCAITLKTETMGDLTLTLKTPGKEEIAAALLADLYDIYYRGDPAEDPELFELDRDELMLENLGK